MPSMGPPDGQACTWGALNDYADCGFGDSDQYVRGVVFCDVHADCVEGDPGIDVDAMWREFRERVRSGFNLHPSG